MRAILPIIALSIIITLGAGEARAFGGGGGDGGDGPGDTGGWGTFGNASDLGGTDGGFDGGGGDDGYGSGVGGSTGTDFLSSEYIRALGEERTEKGLRLLKYFLSENRRELAVQRDLGTLCSVNDCFGLDESTAIKILNNAIEDSEKTRQREIQQQNVAHANRTLYVAILAFLVSLISLICSQINFFKKIIIKLSGSKQYSGAIERASAED